MLTPEVSVNTATFLRGGLYKQTASSMSRRYARRILYFLIIGGVTALVYFVFSIVKVPAKEGWKGGVQNMQIQDDIKENDYQDNVNLPNGGQDDVLNKGQDQGNNLMAAHQGDVKDIAAQENIVDEINRDEDYALNDNNLDSINAVKDDGAEYHIDDEILAIKSQKGSRDEQDNANVYEDDEGKEINENNYKNKKMQNAGYDFRKYKDNFTLPPDFLIKNQQGEVIGFKHLKNGMEDLINMEHFKNNVLDTDLNKLPLNKDDFAQDIGQDAFNRAQQEVNPFLQNNNIGQAGDRRQLQRGRFGDQLPQDNIMALNNNNFIPQGQLNNNQVNQNKLGLVNGQGRNDEKPFQTFEEYLKDRERQRGQLFNGPGVPQGPFEDRENNKIQDNFAGNMNGVIQNDRLNLRKENADIFDNANNLKALQDLNPMLRDNNKEPKDLNPLPGNNILLNLNPLIPVANNINLKEQDVARQNNPFIAGRKFLENPGVALNQLNSVQNQSMLNGDGQVNNGFQELNQQQQNAEIQEPQQQQQSYTKEQTQIPEQRVFIEDLTAPVSVQAKCIDFRFPTGSGPLCIHSGDKDAAVSAKIEASSLYEVDIMNHILLIMTSDTRLGFVDVGAGLGLFTIAVALMMRDVLAVEPLKVNCDLIHKNALENHVSHKIVLVSQALSNESYLGLTVFSDATGGYGGVQVSRLTSYMDFNNLPTGANIVQVTTLDNLLQVAPFKRAVMKLDVGEGMEANILGGSSKFLAAIDVPYIITRWSVRQKLHAQSETLEKLVKLGYVARHTWNGPKVDINALRTDHSFLVWTKI